MKKELITRQYTVAGYLTNMFWLIILAFFVISFTLSRSLIDSTMPIVLWISGLLFLYPLYKVYIKRRRLKHRPSELLEVSQALKGQFTPGLSSQIEQFYLMSLADLGKQRQQKYSNFMATDDWHYCDYSYAVYYHTKYGDYKGYTEHYGVMTTQLPRALPNVFFDSLKARKKQFRFHFTRKQRHSLEGDFDRYFSTYFPNNYTVDSLSFISPDVMLALKDAADYDIEIMGNRLFLYAPLFEPKSQLTDMATKLAAIKKQLLDNILTYRDERLPYEIGRQRVSIQGASLNRSKFWSRITMTVIVIFYIFWFIMMLTSSD